MVYNIFGNGKWKECGSQRGGVSKTPQPLRLPGKRQRVVNCHPGILEKERETSGIGTKGF